MGRILIVSSPTIDIIRGRCRAGGPSLYAGGLASLMGWEAYAIGPYGYSTYPTVMVEDSLGVRRTGYPTPGRGLVFTIEYDGDDRRIRMVGDPQVMDDGRVAGLARENAPYDAILISPVYGEEYGSVPPLLSGYARYTALDVQGYYRVGLPSPGGERLVSIVHLSEDEGEGPATTYVNIVTRGYGRVTIHYRDGLLELRDPQGPILDDPTGAGDAFTGALLIYLSRGYTVEDAVVEASRSVSSILPLLHERAWLDDCMFSF